jgi:hypothetical protein
VPVIAIGSTNLITIDRLKDAVTGDFINDAAASAALLDADGVVIESGIALTYVSSSDGRYQGFLPADAAMTDGETYRVVVTVTSGGRTLVVEHRDVARTYRGRSGSGGGGGGCSC